MEEAQQSSTEKADYKETLAALRITRGSKGRGRMSDAELQAWTGKIQSLIQNYEQLISKYAGQKDVTAAMVDLAELHGTLSTVNETLANNHRSQAIEWYQKVLQNRPVGGMAWADISLALAQVYWCGKPSGDDLSESEKLIRSVLQKYDSSTTRHAHALSLLSVLQARQLEFSAAEETCRSLLQLGDTENIGQFRQWQALAASNVVQSTLWRRDLKLTTKREWLDQFLSSLPAEDGFQQVIDIAEKQFLTAEKVRPDRVPLTARAKEFSWILFIVVNVGLLGAAVIYWTGPKSRAPS